MDGPSGSSNIGSGVAHKPSNGSFPIKRKPEEEVQFVSSKPVKKCRGSKDCSAAQAQRSINPTDTSRGGPLPGDTGPVNTPSHVVSSLLTSQPLHELSNFNRGASLPSMENYVFPPPHDGITRKTARSSPMLSPKQLPQAVPSSQADNQLSPTIPLNPNDAKPPVWCTASWAASSVPAQPTSMNIHMTPTEPTMNLYVQPSAPEPPAAVHGEEQQSRTSEKLTDPAQCTEPVPQPRKELGAEHIQNNHHYPLEESTGLVQSKKPSGTQKAWQPAQPTSQILPGSMPHTQPSVQQHAGNNGYGVATAHAFPLKPPCATCEQMRQQALHNKTNMYPVIGSSSHASHGWNSTEVAHLNHPVHMQPAPFPAAGFGMNPSMAQNHLHRPQHVYHGQVPMGYGLTHVSAQGPYPTPVQRIFPGPDMSASESGPGVPSHKFNTNPQLNASPGSSAMPQTERSQHTQAQYGSSQPPAAQSSLTAEPSPTPAAAPAPRPTTPSPTEKHSPNLIVDIAEICEALFPWDEVAERHSVPRQKVVDTFAAIIQLPLIRCTTDKKRHGRLATNRLKDYTRGKNAMCMASTASPATPPAPAKSDSNENQDSRPVLHGVVELANSMAPVAFPPTLTKRYPGTW